MARRSRALPLHAGQTFVVGHDNYLPVIPTELRRQAVRWWTYGGILRSVQLPGRGGDGGELVKTLQTWGGATSPAEVLAHAEEVREQCGARCVSGYGGAVRASLGASLPVESYTHTNIFNGLIRAGWQAALRPGVHGGTWHHYDLQSAYYSALLEGLPDPATYRRTRQLGPHGMYVLRLAPGGRARLPHPYDLESVVIASYEDVHTYGLPVAEVLEGVRWTRDYDIRRIVHACDRWSFAKRARRCFWGGWIADRRVRCHTRAAEWEPLAPRPHPIWAALILGRVRRKVWLASARAVHVYTDSLITSETFATGTAPGEWRHVTTYDHGVRIGGAGQYGPAHGPWDRWAGMPITSARRQGGGVADGVDVS